MIHPAWPLSHSDRRARPVSACLVGVVCAAALISVAAASNAQSPPPELTAPVNDFAGVLDADTRARLDTLIRQLQAASGDVMVVATVTTFQPAADIRMYATEMFENNGHGIGHKGRDNGLLLLLAVEDREVWVEVGYDLESIITDGFAGETSRLTMVPFFYRGDYGGGLLAGAGRLADRIAAARNVTIEGVPLPESAAGSDAGGHTVIVFLIVALAAINLARGIMGAMFGRRRGGRRRRWASTVGPFGAGYGGWSAGHRGGWSSGGGGFGGGFGGFGGGRSGGGGGGARW
jgi:uncharacterized protein